MKEIHGSTHGCELLDLESPSIAAQLLSRVQLFATPWTGAHQAPLSMEFPGENTGVGCHKILEPPKMTIAMYLSKELKHLLFTLILE